MSHNVPYIEPVWQGRSPRLPYMSGRLEYYVLSKSLSSYKSIATTMLAFLGSLFWLFFYVVQCVIVYRIGRFVWNILHLIYVYFLAPRLGIGFDFHKFKDKWAVITGPTDGIGKEYLYQMAKKGLKKFLLISRDQRKLQATSDWILSAFPDCQIKTQSFTFGRDDYGILRKVIEPLDVGILVNNAGTGPEILHRFSEDPQTDRMVYHVNTGSVFEMMQIVLPKLVKAKCGAIVNVSSLQSVRPIALIASYSSSKAYISYLTDCVHREHLNEDIIIQCLIPVLVSTKILHYNQDDTPFFDKILLVDADKFAAEAINTLGVTHYTAGCWWHDFQLALIHLVPWWLLRLSAEPYYRAHQSRMLREYNRKHAKLN